MKRINESGIKQLMPNPRPFPSTYENAYRLIIAARKVAKSYKHIHFWEHPTEGTFNYKLCKELDFPPTASSVRQMLVIVNEWNIHQILKGIYKGTFTYHTGITPRRKQQMIK